MLWVGEERDLDLSKHTVRRVGAKRQVPAIYSQTSLCVCMRVCREKERANGANVTTGMPGTWEFSVLFLQLCRKSERRATKS